MGRRAKDGTAEPRAARAGRASGPGAAAPGGSVRRRDGDGVGPGGARPRSFAAGVGPGGCSGCATWVLLLGCCAGRTRSPGSRCGRRGVRDAHRVHVQRLAGTYMYRLPGVPAFVPPGHGLVYLGARVPGASALLPRKPRLSVGLAAAGVTGCTLRGGWSLSPRLDVLGRAAGRGACCGSCGAGGRRWSTSARSSS